MICAISILRVPKPAPIDWIVDFVTATCVLPTGGRVHVTENHDEYILDIEGLRPEHPLIHGGYCDCGIRQGFCTRCQGQGWVAWWAPPSLEAVEHEIIGWLDLLTTR